jgi:hypothetical protein
MVGRRGNAGGQMSDPGPGACKNALQATWQYGITGVHGQANSIRLIGFAVRWAPMLRAETMMRLSNQEGMDFREGALMRSAGSSR